MDAKDQALLGIGARLAYPLDVAGSLAQFLEYVYVGEPGEALLLACHVANRSNLRIAKTLGDDVEKVAIVMGMEAEDEVRALVASIDREGDDEWSPSDFRDDKRWESTDEPVRRVWFSAMVNFVVHIGHEGASSKSRSVIVFRAVAWDDARETAARLALAREKQYVNAEGEDVSWTLASIETLDLLGATSLDGREVYSEPAPLDQGDEGMAPKKFELSDQDIGSSGV